MFWEKSYSQSQNIESLLKREDVTIEELLDDEDILQECKLQTRRLMQFLTRPGAIKHLITLIITEPPENVSVAERFKYSNTACEILTSGLPSLDEKLVEDTEILQTLYSFLENEPPLNPLLAAFFSKTFSMLISKKHEQDWFLYQKMCLQLLEFIKSRGNFLDLMLKHFATPVITDLLLQIIKEVQGGTLKKNLYEWLTEQRLVERVIRILADAQQQDKHGNAAEFLIDLIKHGRSMRQSDQEDSLELAFTGTDPLLQALEEENMITLLLDSILREEPQESSIVGGILILLTLVDVSIVDEPASDKALKKMIDKEKDNHERVVSNVINIIAPRIEEFHKLLLEPPKKNNFSFRETKCFGLTRLQICRLFTVLLQTGNETIINAVCETEYFSTLLTLFKEYSWNNFLHSEVEKCMEYVFGGSDQNDNEKTVETTVSALQKHVLTNCKITSRLLDCWLHNRDIQSSQKGRRLGYMGHLIQILRNVSLCLFKVDSTGALLESVLNEEDLAKWKALTDPETGELAKELSIQSKLLADCDPKAIQNDNIISDHDSNIEVNLADDPGPLNDTTISKLYEYLENENVMSCLLSSCDEITANLQRQMKVWGENAGEDVGFDRFVVDTTKPDVNSLNVSINPWGADPFTDAGANDNDMSGWADFTSNNFADFDSHFSLYTNDFGDRYHPSQENNESTDLQTELKILIEKNDNNANVEKFAVSDVGGVELCDTKSISSSNIGSQNDNNESTSTSSPSTIIDDSKTMNEKNSNREEDIAVSIESEHQAEPNTNTLSELNGPSPKLSVLDDDPINGEKLDHVLAEVNLNSTVAEERLQEDGVAGLEDVPQKASEQNLESAIKGLEFTNKDAEKAMAATVGEKTSIITENGPI